jgi:5-methylcytosine-specific restriction endonuclease McrA
MSALSSRGRAWEALRKQVIANAAGYCVKCGAENSNHVDHIVPKAKGGQDVLENLQLLCAKCNTSKGSKTEGKAVTWFNAYWFPHR